MKQIRAKISGWVNIYNHFKRNYSLCFLEDLEYLVSSARQIIKDLSRHLKTSYRVEFKILEG